jgi:hypothetical protein
MRTTVLAAIFAIVSGITVASLAPAAVAQSRSCASVDPFTGACRSWGSAGRGGSTCAFVDTFTGACKVWDSAGRGGATCAFTDAFTGACKAWDYRRR